ncbi:sulfatase [Actinoplanes derwentensis]|uniref:sulfatase n=1 Tax=Actinoplanes derwentensis TaxID=113562 RepID=UPI001E343F3D|nr:sulfatase [Actinoplanes derwentensis]
MSTGFAAVLVFLALIVPDQITRLPPGNSPWTALLRIPVEALIAGAILLLLPKKGRRGIVIGLGVTLGLLTVIKMIDVAFYAVLARRFDPVLDWILADDGFNFLVDSIGKAATIGVSVGLVLFSVLLVAGMAWAVLRLDTVMRGHRIGAWRGIGTAGVAWGVLAVLGVQLIGGLPVASHAAADLAGHTVMALPQNLADRKKFAAEVQVDNYRDRDPDQMLTALRDKDVIIGFIESYGRNAIEDPAYNGAVLASLQANTEKLTAAGYVSRSGFLSSPTAGGGSWLAHSTFLSGLWIDNEQRYRSLVSSDRLTLTRAFANSGHRSVGIQPGIVFAWPEGAFYGYDQIYDSHSFGYNGPSFSWSPMPDQFVMSAFQQLEYGKPGRDRLLAEITLTSSHTPWSPVPSMLDWDALGDGSVYGPVVAQSESTANVWKHDEKIRTEYARSIAYSIDSLLGHLAEYGNDDTVLVFLGDHQPASVVVGTEATRDVPITIIAKDPKTLDRIDSWGWTDGLKPDPAAPISRMDTFRDKFLAAFGPEGDPH